MIKKMSQTKTWWIDASSRIRLILFQVIAVFALFCSATSIGYCANISINHAGDVSEAQIRHIVNATNRTVKFMEQNFARKLSRDITINIYSDNHQSDFLSANETDNSVGGKSSVGTVNLVINPNSTEYYICFLTAHELVHQYQMDVLGSYQVLNKNMWFTEGMADYIGSKVAEPLNPAMTQKFRKNAITQSYADPISLFSITDKASWRKNFSVKKKTYAKADLAIIYLVDTYSQELLFPYLFHLYKEAPSTALKNTYGISMADLEMRVMGNSAILPDNTSIFDGEDTGSSNPSTSTRQNTWNTNNSQNKEQPVQNPSQIESSEVNIDVNMDVDESNEYDILKSILDS